MWTGMRRWAKAHQHAHHSRVVEGALVNLPHGLAEVAHDFLEHEQRVRIGGATILHLGHPTKQPAFQSTIRSIKAHTD